MGQERQEGETRDVKKRGREKYKERRDLDIVRIDMMEVGIFCKTR